MAVIADLRLGELKGVLDLPENDTDTTDKLPWVELTDATLTFRVPKLEIQGMTLYGKTTLQ